MLHYLDIAIGFAVVMLLLSLLVTMGVQAISALLNMRAFYLRIGLNRAFETLHAPLAKHRKLASKILKHPLVCTWFRRATALRAKELVKVIELMDHDKAALDATTSRQLADLVAQTDWAGHLGRWFDTVMDRTTERFVFASRVLGLAGGLVLAFAMQVDSLSLIDRLSVDAQLRNSLVASVESTMQLAERHKNPEIANRDLVDKAVDAGRRAGGLDEPVEVEAGTTTREEGRRLLDTALQSVDEPAKAKGLEAYESEFEQLMNKRYELLRTDAAKLHGDLMDILRPPWAGGSFAPDSSDWRLEHWLGMLVSALLLSLGAPFWFNMLRNLSSLRPILAKRVEQDASQTNT